MSSLFDVSLRPTEAEDQEVTEAFFGSLHVVTWIHWTENVVVRHLLVEGGYQALKSFFSDRAVDVFIFH